MPSGRLSVEHGRTIVAGIAEGCRQAGCALIGGETAEMPGLYAAGDYDLAGFAVGAVERGRLLTGSDVEAGDVVLGLASSGLHSNGFSLVREGGGTMRPGATPRRRRSIPTAPSARRCSRRPASTSRGCLAAHAAGGLKALAHITGGGLVGNIPRVLPPEPRLRDRRRAVGRCRRCSGGSPQAGGVAPAELARTFNCGIGMVAVVAPDRAAELAREFERHGERVFAIGRIVAHAGDGPRVDISASRPHGEAEGRRS